MQANNLKHLVISLITLLIPSSIAVSICFSNYGCFSDEQPYGSYLGYPRIPSLPSDINTKFFLYTKNSGPYEIDPESKPAVIPQEFNPEIKTKIIIHGFRDKGINDKLIIPLRRALQHHPDPMNIIVVDWTDRAATLYPIAVGNTRLVGVQVARLIDCLVKNTSAKLESVHLIGFSLGAQISGYAGEWFKKDNRKISHITGLDSAGPGFTHEHTLVRLDPSDAEFVDVIHTNTIKFGTSDQSGHVDFYPNGGKLQPKCELSDGLPDYAKCHHQSAMLYYTESINSQCPWRAYSCSDMTSFEKGECLICGDKACATMGFDCSRNLTKGKYYLLTDSSSPYCVYHYRLSVKTTNRRRAGTIRSTTYFQLTGKNGEKSLKEKADWKNTDRGEIESMIIRSSMDLGDIQSITVEHDGLWRDSWHIDEIIVKPGFSNIGFVAKVQQWLDDGTYTFSFKRTSNPDKHFNTINNRNF